MKHKVGHIITIASLSKFSRCRWAHLLNDCAASISGERRLSSKEWRVRIHVVRSEISRIGNQEKIKLRLAWCSRPQHAEQENCESDDIPIGPYVYASQITYMRARPDTIKRWSSILLSILPAAYRYITIIHFNSVRDIRIIISIHSWSPLLKRARPIVSVRIINIISARAGTHGAREEKIKMCCFWS